MAKELASQKKEFEYERSEYSHHERTENCTQARGLRARHWSHSWVGKRSGSEGYHRRSDACPAYRQVGSEQWDEGHRDHGSRNLARMWQQLYRFRAGENPLPPRSGNLRSLLKRRRNLHDGSAPATGQSRLETQLLLVKEWHHGHQPERVPHKGRAHSLI